MFSATSRASNRRRNTPSRSSAPAGRARRCARWWRATRAEAEDACELVEVGYQELPAVTDAETALDAGTPVIHPELGDNLTFERVLVAGDPDQGFKDADAVIETTFVFGRHTGVTNEPRAIVADWNPGEERLTVYHGHAGAAHDAEPVRQASRRSKSIRFAC